MQNNDFQRRFSSRRAALSPGASFAGMFLLVSVEGIHALHTMDTSVPHRLAAADVGAAELASGLQKHLNA